MWTSSEQIHLPLLPVSGFILSINPTSVTPSFSLLPSCFCLTPPQSHAYFFPSLSPSLSSPESKPTMLISGSSPLKSFRFPSPSLMVRLKCHSTQGHPTHTAGGEGAILSAIYLSGTWCIILYGLARKQMHTCIPQAKIVKTSLKLLWKPLACVVLFVCNEIWLHQPKPGSMFCTKTVG